MGNADRLIRVVLALIISALYFTGTLTGTIGFLLIILGGIFLAVSVFGFCPIYALLGVNTCKKK